MTRYDTSKMTDEERAQLLIKLVPGDVITVRPGQDKGCPCGQCTSDWGEALYANGNRQRGGWCPELRQLVGIRAGYVSRYCPIPELVEGEVYDPGTLRLQPFTIIPAGASVKGAAEASRDSTFPTVQPRQGAASPSQSPRRERVGHEGIGLEGWC